MASTVMRTLNGYYKEGRVADKESFKALCRKLTKDLVAKERKNNPTPYWHAKHGPAVEKYVHSYMKKLREKGVETFKKE